MQLSTERTHKLIKDCLAKSFSVGQIAQILGVTPSAVSQQISTYKLASSEATPPTAANDLDSLLDSTEHRILSSLAEKLTPATTAQLNPLQLGKLLTQVNGAKRRAASSQQPTSAPAATATLVLPQFILNQHVVINDRNELKEVGGVLLESLPSQQVKQLFGATHETTSPATSLPAVSATNQQPPTDLLDGI